MLRSMLVGLDASECSQAAVDLGIAWATRFDALLAAVGVINEPAIRGPQSTPIGAGAIKHQTDEALVEQARKHVENLLSQFALRCAEAKVAYKLLEDVGSPAEQIIREAQRFDLIMLGQQSCVTVNNTRATGEVVEHVLRNAPRPVVVVPSKPRHGDGVLVAYDGSVQAARALQAFVACQLQHLGDVRVISIDPKSSVEAAKKADRAVEYLGLHAIKAKLHPVVSTKPVGRVLLEESASLNSALLVMGAYGKNRLKEFFVGSVTRTMLQESDAPVFVYH